MTFRLTGRHWIPRPWAWTAAAVITLVSGCGDSTNPATEETRAPTDLTILQLAQAPVLMSDSVSFWAVRGEDRAVEMYFADSLGQPAERLLRFEVEDNALSRYPDGRKFHGRDSVLITIRVTDPATLAFEFAPSGLRFKSHDPAKLTVAYGRASNTPWPVNRHDDDDEDDDDDEEGGFGIWMQEQANGDYVRLNSRLNSILEEVEADVPGFSRYAVAW